MTDYLTDIQINKEKDIFLDSANDLSLTSGVNNLEQGIALSALDVTGEVIGQRATTERLSLLETEIENYLAQDPHISNVLNVRTISINRDSGTANMEINVLENEDFIITVGDT